MTAYAFSSFLKDEMKLFIEKRSRELSPLTIRGDIRYLRRLDEFLAERDAHDVTFDLISESIASLDNLANNTKNQYIAVLRTFLTYANALRGTRYYVPDYRAETDDYEPYYFVEATKRAIYEIVDNWPSRKQNTLPWISIELPVIVRIMDGCGTRVTEILTLRVRDVELDSGVLVIKNAKNSKQRRVPMSKSLSEILADYCRATGVAGHPDAYLFPRQSMDECLLEGDVGHRFRRILEGLRIRMRTNPTRFERGPCLYNLRHTFMINSFQQLTGQGVTLDDTICYLSVYAGHNSLQETQKYLKFCAELFPEELDRFFSVADELAPGEDKWERWGL